MLVLFFTTRKNERKKKKSLFFKISLLSIDFYILHFLALCILNIRIYFWWKLTQKDVPLKDLLLPNLKKYVAGQEGYYLNTFLIIVLLYVMLVIVKKIYVNRC